MNESSFLTAKAIAKLNLEESDLTDSNVNVNKMLEAFGGIAKENSFLGDFPTQLKTACKQLSQLIAWMWSSSIGTSLDEQTLKKAFNSVLKYQAFTNTLEGSDAISALLLGNNQDKNINSIGQKLEFEIPSITLKKVYEQLTKNAVPYAFTQEYVNLFYSKVNPYLGEEGIFYDFFGTENPTREPRFVVIISLPPKPELSDFTVTEEELKNWANETTSYSPPHFNPYIPISAST
ncbi:hypothetical protein [Gloeothece verrucosa]|uniref:Uncharacterized protein n=1 Tax=Gloeothece verrucosa (strain PCC 7822) TaxID=497965 RepID=E0ULZ5_GLOV7|nr:hypothetical protein [Gloeothece verrucosa]ADN17975.1 hypothetical protein Cyan7822_6147 [Gloeothece verrucosa PCC 7822]